jgi:DNA replication protein DnaC
LQKHCKSISFALQKHFTPAPQLLLYIFMFKYIVRDNTVLPICPVCEQSTVVIQTALGYSILDYPCGHAEQALNDRIRVEQSEQASLRMVEAGIAGMYTGATFESFIPAAGTQSALDAARGMVVSILEHKALGLVLYSQGNGCGKTHLARALLRDVIMHQLTGCWIRHCDMNHEARRQYKNCNVLVVDDMWKRATKTSAEILYDILDIRVARRTPTIVTTNVTQKQAEYALGLEHSHVISGVYSRLSAMQIVELSGPDYRPRMNNKQP